MKKRQTEILIVAGARPNFMKIAPILEAMKRSQSLRPYIVHTGQHYDALMSRKIFQDLGLPKPHVNLNVGSGTHAAQTAQVMARLEKILINRRPMGVLVVGDVNSTLAAALTAVKLHIPVAHVEAGLRSRDRTMPEEINRLLTDAISDLLFTHSKEAGRNLAQEGIDRRKVFFVGNVMIDTLKVMLPSALRSSRLSNRPYGLITLHRPANVDDRKVLRGIFDAFRTISNSLPLFFPVHPRTARKLKQFGILKASPNLHLTEPLSYVPFLGAMARAQLVLTDSGGIQEETTYLGVPCLTLRDTSERMVTVTHGTNCIVGRNPKKIVSQARQVLKAARRKKKSPPLWDGKSAERIVKILERTLAP